jgi:hypothetical protein
LQGATAEQAALQGHDTALSARRFQGEISSDAKIAGGFPASWGAAISGRIALFPATVTQ